MTAPLSLTDSTLVEGAPSFWACLAVIVVVAFTVALIPVVVQLAELSATEVAHRMDKRERSRRIESRRHALTAAEQVARQRTADDLQRRFGHIYAHPSRIVRAYRAFRDPEAMEVGEQPPANTKRPGNAPPPTART